MAEKLKRVQPTSSIANALNLDAVKAATEPAPSSPPARASAAPVTDLFAAPATQQRASVVPMPQPAITAPVSRSHPPEPPAYAPREATGEPANIIRQFQLTASTDATLQKVIAAYSRAVGFELSKTEFLRAVLHALEPTVELHAREASRIGRLKRHKNEAWLFHKRDELERTIARAFTAAMRAAPSLE